MSRPNAQRAAPAEQEGRERQPREWGERCSTRGRSGALDGARVELPRSRGEPRMVGRLERERPAHRASLRGTRFFRPNEKRPVRGQYRQVRRDRDAEQQPDARHLAQAPIPEK